MKELLNFALNYPHFWSCLQLRSFKLVILRIKKRYVNDGVLIRRLPTTKRDHHPSKNQRE